MQAKTGRLLLTAAFVIALLALMSLPAMAAPVSYEPVYELNDQNKAFTGTGPYATVTLKLENKTTIDFTVKAAEGFTFWSGKGNPMFGFNYKGDDTLSVKTMDGVLLDTGKDKGKDKGTEIGGFGKFDYTFTADAYKSLDTMTFQVIDTKGTFSSVEDLIKENTKGNLFAVHLAQTGGNTGNAGGGTPVPEPGSLALLGAGLISFGGLMRRYRR